MSKVGKRFWGQGSFLSAPNRLCRKCFQWRCLRAVLAESYIAPMPIACGRSAHAAPLLSRAIRRPIMCNHECHRCPCLTVGSSSRPSIGPDRLHLITCLFIGAHCFLLGLGCDLGCVPCTVCGVVPVLHQADKQTSLVCSVECVAVDSHAINLVSPWSRWSRARLSMQAFPVAEGCDKLLFGANHCRPHFLK